MDGSFLQRLKFLVHTLLPLSGDAILVFVGLASYLATCLIARHALTWAWALLPGVCLAIALESWEVFEHYGRPGLGRASAGDLLTIALRHSRDVLIMNLAPLAVYLAALALDRLARN